MSSLRFLIHRLQPFLIRSFLQPGEDLSPDRVELLLPHGGQGANLTITRNPQAPDDGQRAICMEIWVDDVDREYEWLLENQITVSRPPASLPWGFRYLGLYDPDGNHISLVSKLGEK